MPPKLEKQGYPPWQHWYVALLALCPTSSRCSVCVCHQVMYTQWPTPRIWTCLYGWVSEAVSGAFNLDLRVLLTSPHPHPLPIKQYLLIPRLIKDSFPGLNTRSSKRDAVRELGEGSDLSKEGQLKSARRQQHTSTDDWVGVKMNFLWAQIRLLSRFLSTVFLFFFQHFTLLCLDEELEDIWGSQGGNEYPDSDV